MEIRVLIKRVDNIQTGVSAAGREWKSRTFIAETFGQYPKVIAFSIFGDKVDAIIPQESTDVDVSFDIESRAWSDKNGIERWSTDCRVFKITPHVETSNYQQPQAAPQQPAYSAATPAVPHVAPAAQPQPAPTDDLPF